MLLLSVIQGPDSGKRYQLPTNEPQLIGRSREALPITDTTVSRRHAELTPDGDRWYIRDLTSQNGTWVNGVRITGRITLEPGDQIRVGSTVLVFGYSDTHDPAAVRISPAEIDADIEHRIPSNEDSVVLAEPEPRQAAVDHLRVIYQLTSLTTEVADERELLQKVVELVFAEFKPERGVIMLAGPTPDAEPRPVAIKYREDAPSPDTDGDIHVSSSILHAAMREGEGVLSSNAMADPRFKSGDSVQQYQIRSAICSPIRFRDRTFGAVYIDSSIANYTFTREQLALLNAIGRHTALALAIAEQTRRRVHTERLAAIGETVASLSHSIKNILQGLRGGADVVEIGLRKQDLKITGDGWAILKRNLDRIVGLTLNMLAFSGRRQPELELTKIGTLVEECAELIEPRREEKAIALLVDSDPEMPPIAVDPNLLHQAVMNIIGNAVEAVERETGAVTVRVQFHESPAGPLGGGILGAKPGPLGAIPTVEIAVIDNGPGIPKDRAKWIFEPFNTTKGIRGTGLGLAVTKRIVDDHRGKITIESEPGHGATFRVFIPGDLDARLDPGATANQRTGDPTKQMRLS